MTYLIIILIIIVLIAVGVSLSQDDGGEQQPPDNNRGKRWEDLYNFKEFLYNNYTVTEKPTEDVKVIDDIDDPENAAWLIIGVEKEFTSEEASTVRNFVTDGGTCIIAADSEFANKIAQQFAVSFTGHRIIETVKYDAGGIFIPTDAYIGGTYYHILTNSPVGITFNKQVTTFDINTIAQSSEASGIGDYSFLDKNDNGVSEADDDFGPINMIVEVKQKTGTGKIIFICDSAVFTDDLWDLETQKASYENDAFAEALLKYSVSRDSTVVDDFSKHVNVHSDHKIYPL